jgi:hypothetical protein
MGRAVKWAVVIGSILLFSNLGYYGYQVLIVDGYGSGAPVPTDPNITVEKPSPSPSAAAALGAVLLPVPFTTQAPLGDWGRHQESCEEANLAQVSAYYSGDHSSVLDPRSADRTIAQLVTWQNKNWGSEDDLTDLRLGELAQAYYGYEYRVLPLSDAGMRAQLHAGHPVILGVTTHGLGNPHYPNYEAHYLQPGYSVSHFVTIVGYDGSNYIVNDPGITAGRGYPDSYLQLAFAVRNLDQQHPNLDEGLVMLVVYPHGG